MSALYNPQVSPERGVGAEEIKKVSPTETAFVDLEDACNFLDESCARLEQKLMPVMSRTSDADKTEPGDSMPPCSPVVESLRVKSRMIRRVAEQLSRIYQKVEL